MEDQLASIRQVKGTLLDLAVRFGPRVLAALLILTLGFFVSRWAARWTDRGLAHLDLEPPVRLLLSRIVRGTAFVLFLIMALQNLGVELLPLIAGLGVAGAGIALAMQGVLSNIAAGLSIIFTKPYRIGEYAVLKRSARVLADPAPLVQVSRLADSAIHIAVKPWVSVEDYGAAHSEVTRAIVETFRSGDIAIAYPQREVRLLGGSPDIGAAEKENSGGAAGSAT